MALGKLSGRQWRPFLHGALVTLVAGWVFSYTQLGTSLEWWSFDFPTLFNGTRGFPELVLVQMDESSHSHLKQSAGKPWDRHLHAGLVDFLREEGARQVVFDVELNEQVDDPSSTAALAKAMRAHGNVVIGARLETTRKRGYVGATELLLPERELLVPGVTWALSWNLPLGEIVRLHPFGRDPDTALPWTAALAVNPALTNSGARHDDERWVRHYGPGGTLDHVSYWRATNEAPGFYRGKTVFIGGRPSTGFVGQEVDQFRTAWSRWNGPTVSGLELTATAWLNLVRGDWLTRVPGRTEFLALTFFGALLGGAVAFGSTRRSFLLSAGAFVGVCSAALWLFHARGFWCDWAVAAFVQVPVAIGWRMVAGHLELRREKRWLEAPLEDLFAEPASSGSTTPSSAAANPSSNLPATPASMSGAPPIPDYELLRCVGRGAYGEVWLARDVIGGFRVVKIVRRVAFDDDGPYEREFRGLQKFAPISREHPRVVQVLHVGLNRAGGFFHYVMEAGDDEQTGQQIDPERYTPRNLGRDLRQRGRLDAVSTAELGLDLCEALAFLHERGLIHRDIKPANVIFVNGRAKLADVGLVTELASRAHGVTQVGTEGYIAPEGSGTAAGDVFALGRLLAETFTPSTASEDEAAIALRRILDQAQAVRPEDRFPNARTMGDALVAWRNKYLPPPSQTASIQP